MKQDTANELDHAAVDVTEIDPTELGNRSKIIQFCAPLRLFR